MLDEFIHHGAEISLLRDLYRWQRPVSTDALTERAIRGDHSLLVDLESFGPETTSTLLSTAASFGRWALAEEMMDRGVSPAVTGRTPAHAAAGAGELDILRKLVDHGADLAAARPRLRCDAVDLGPVHETRPSCRLARGARRPGVIAAFK